MTNSMIPYSFVPGTKAKAGEVNANFISLANFIEQNKNIATENIDNLNNIIEDLDTIKADKTELITDHTVTEFDTDLNNYQTTGTYIFSASYTPVNIPKSESGTLKVFGHNTSTITQVWMCNDTDGEIFTRTYADDEWSSWKSLYGTVSKNNLGYLKLPNGLLIQWGFGSDKLVTYPIAFTELACPLFTKYGYGNNFIYGETGFTDQTLTGFSMDTMGRYFDINWIAIGY